MPTWPSANKAVTTYTDQGTDRLADARPEINKTISNVNDIIDTFAISSPSDGDLLQYSTSTGAWEQVAGTTVNPVPSAVLAMTPGIDYYNLASGVAAYQWTVQSDGSGILTYDYDSAGDKRTLQLSAGTYEIKFIGSWPQAGGGQSITTELHINEGTPILVWSNGNSSTNGVIWNTSYYNASSFDLGITYKTTNTNTGEIAFTSSLNYGRVIITKLA